jgi:hypothetical protein
MKKNFPSLLSLVFLFPICAHCQENSAQASAAAHDTAPIAPGQIASPFGRLKALFPKTRSPKRAKPEKNSHHNSVSHTDNSPEPASDPTNDSAAQSQDAERPKLTKRLSYVPGSDFSEVEFDESVFPPPTLPEGQNNSAHTSIGNTSEKAGDQPSSAVSPIESPKPKVDFDEAKACPGGPGEPCALIGGMRYYPDSFGFARHNRTWGEAMRTPGMLIGASLLMASTIADIETTNACVKANTCTEGNPLWGKKPSRGLMYGVALPIDATVIFLYAREKKQGRGFGAFISMWCLTMAHTYAAAHNAAIR